MPIIAPDLTNLIHELRYQFHEMSEEFEPLKNATLHVHPKDYCKFVEVIKPEYTSILYRTDPPQFAGIFIRQTDLIPEGVAMLIKNDAIIGNINLDHAVISIRSIPLGPRALA